MKTGELRCLPNDETDIPELSGTDEQTADSAARRHGHSHIDDPATPTLWAPKETDRGSLRTNRRAAGKGTELRGEAELRRLGMSSELTADEPFEGTLWMTQTRSVMLTRFRTTSMSSRRDRQRTGDPYGAYLQLGMVCEGHATFSQGGREGTAETGDAFAVRLDRPFRSSLRRPPDGERAEVVQLYLPLDHLRVWGAPIEDVAGHTWTLSAPAAAGLLFVRDVVADPSEPALRDTAGHLDQILFRIALIAMQDRQPDTDTADVGPDAALRREVLDVIDRRYAEPDLNSDAIARYLHVSRRTLFRAFENHETSIAGLIRNRRLDAAAILLDEGSRTVKEVARQCGFRNTDQLARSFRARYGVAPAGYRSRARSA